MVSFSLISAGNERTDIMLMHDNADNPSFLDHIFLGDFRTPPHSVSAARTWRRKKSCSSGFQRNVGSDAPPGASVDYAP